MVGKDNGEGMEARLVQKFKVQSFQSFNRYAPFKPFNSETRRGSSYASRVPETSERC
jgi:hypothetical protein